MTTIKPRPYQVNGILSLRQKLLQGKKRIILMCPTGGGKGLIMAMIAEMGLKKGSKLLTVLYGSDLIRQTDKNYQRYFDIESKIIMGGIKQPDQNSIIASISTLHRRELPDVDFVIVDECHQSKSDSYKKIFEKYKDKIIIGLSATPINHLTNFEDYVVLATVKELIKAEHLVQPRHFAPRSKVNTDGLKKVKGEWQDSDLEREEMKIVGDIVHEWIERATNRPTIAFSSTVKSSMFLREQFLLYKIPSYHIDGSTPAEKRDQAIRLFKRGKIKVITNVNVFSTGIDVPEISCVIMARPTNSEILYIQQGGRGLRPAHNKKDCIIIDHANNVSRFGLLTDERCPVLTEKDKSKKNQGDVALIKTWVCELCLCTNTASDQKCINCGALKPEKEKKVKHVDGDLEEITESNKRKKIFLADTMPFGKHKGTAFELLPYSYLLWAEKNLDNRIGLQERMKLEVARRKGNLNDNI